MSLFIRLLINAAALWVATQIVPGVSYQGDGWMLIVAALVFGVLNVSVRPILFVLTLPFWLVTLGLFTFILNAFMLWLTGRLSGALGLGFHVNGFGAAFFGALVVTVVSFALSIFVAKPLKSAGRSTTGGHKARLAR
ncbi:MAG: phage holin family protein [Vicinamibacterales bacterium]